MQEDPEVKQHFNLNSVDYNRWMGSESHGMMHYGDHTEYQRNWKEQILAKTGLLTREEVKQAVVHRVEALAEKADIQKGETVVDSGCGRGGNTIWLAENTDAEKIIGLDIDEDLLKKARKNAEEAGVEEKVEFIQQDFDNLQIQDFDIYFAIESQCYSQDERKLAENIYKGLNPGGRIVISDGYRTDKFSHKHEELTRKMHIGWGVDYMAYKSNFQRFLKEAGFQNIQVEPLMEKIAPTSRYLHRASILTAPYVQLRLEIAKGLHALTDSIGLNTEKKEEDVKRYHQLRNLVTTGRYQYIVGKKGLFNQYDFYAEKPR